MGDQQHSWVIFAEAMGIKAGGWSVATRAGSVVSIISFTPEYKEDGQQFTTDLTLKVLARMTLESNAAPSPNPPKAVAPKAVPPAGACGMRPPATGEILVRMVTTDDPTTVMRLGGGWVWDWGNKRCITSLRFAIQGNPTLPGHCTQVALVSTNPGYDEDAVPAPRLKKVIAATGSC